MRDKQVPSQWRYLQIYHGRQYHEIPLKSATHLRSLCASKHTIAAACGVLQLTYSHIRVLKVPLKCRPCSKCYLLWLDGCGEGGVSAKPREKMN